MSGSRLLLLVFLALAIPRVAAAQGGARDVAPLSSEVRAALELLRAGKLQAAATLTERGRTALEEGRRVDPPLRRLGLVHAIARAASFAESRDGDEAAVRTVLGRAGERARPEDVPLLRELEAASPHARPYARAIAREACRKIDASLESRVLVAILRAPDLAARRRALEAINERLARARAKVDAGGELGAAEQAEVADPQLIAALIEALDERPVGADRLPHDLAAEASPSSLHALALIESPAIAALETARREGTPGAEAALSAVSEAALARVRRHPRSSWSSARGALPVVVPGAVACPSCARPLPDNARFCPSCNTPSPSVICPRCGASAHSGFCSRCGGSVTGEPRRCEKCNEPVGEVDRFCHRCGAPVAGAPSH